MLPFFLDDLFFLTVFCLFVWSGPLPGCYEDFQDDPRSSSSVTLPARMHICFLLFYAKLLLTDPFLIPLSFSRQPSQRGRHQVLSLVLLICDQDGSVVDTPPMANGVAIFIYRRLEYGSETEKEEAGRQVGDSHSIHLSVG